MSYDNEVQDITVSQFDVYKMHSRIQKGEKIKGRSIRRLLSYFWAETEGCLFTHLDFDSVNVGMGERIRPAEDLLEKTVAFLLPLGIPINAETTHDGNGGFLMNIFTIANRDLQSLSVKEMETLVHATGIIWTLFDEFCFDRRYKIQQDDRWKDKDFVIDLSKNRG